MEAIRRKWVALFRDKDNKQLLKNVLGNYVVKGGAMLVSLLLTPAYMNYFYSQPLLGMWFTATSIISWIMMFDFGIGSGIRNQLVLPLLRKDKNEIREILSTGYISVAIIVIILSIGLAFVVEGIEWHTVFGISTEEIDVQTLKIIMHILVIGVCVRFFSVLISHVFYAMQLATIPSILILSSNILILVYMNITEPMANAMDIVSMAICQAVATNLPAIIAMFIIFSTKLKGAAPRFRSFKIERVKNILGMGGSLFYIQCLITFVFGVKELLISWFVGAEQVVEYQIYYKLIGMVSGLFSLALTPVWSAVTKAYVEKNYSRIKKLYFTGGKFILVFGALQLVLLVLMPWISKVWLGANAIKVSYTYGVLFCIYNLIYMVVMLNYNFACGMGKTKNISLWLTVAMVFNVVIAYFGCRVVESWITVVVATAIAALPCAIIVPRNLIKNVSKKIKKEK